MYPAVEKEERRVLQFPKMRAVVPSIGVGFCFFLRRRKLQINRVQDWS